MISSLVNPPQGGQYRPLPGSLFPEKYPFDYSEQNSYSYFWLKYYISQRSFFAIPKRPHYVNYEVCCNAMGTDIIDYSEAEIWQLQNEKMTTAELEELLTLHNEYSADNFALRYYQLKSLDRAELSIIEAKKKQSNDKSKLDKRLGKTFDEVAHGRTPVKKEEKEEKE